MPNRSYRPYFESRCLREMRLPLARKASRSGHHPAATLKGVTAAAHSADQPRLDPIEPILYVAVVPVFDDEFDASGV